MTAGPDGPRVLRAARDFGLRRTVCLPLLVSLLLVFLALAFAACGHEPASVTDSQVATSSSTSEKGSPASSPVSARVEEPLFGETTPLIPGEVLLCDAARDFVPPASLPLYRIVPVPITQSGLEDLADRLGMAEPRDYGSPEPPGDRSWANDGRWSLVFFREDLECFRFDDAMGDREAGEAFERGEKVVAVSPEQAIEVADEYLSSRAYGAGLGSPRVFVRTAMGRSGGDLPEVSDVVITRGVSYPAEVGGLRLIGASVLVDVAPGGKVISLSHTVQRSERDTIEVPILPVEEALEDVKGGKGLFPPEARMDTVSRLVVESVELAYYVPPEGLDETHYRPVYVFHVQMTDGSEGSWVVSAYEAGPESAPAATESVADPDAVVARASGQIEAVLGLPAGAVTVSSDRAEDLSGADVILAWEGEGMSRAYLDIDSGRIVAIIPGGDGESPGTLLSTAELDEAALHIAELLGWDKSTLSVEGFTPEEPILMSHGDAPTEYSKRWAGHDEGGLPNGGLIDVALDAGNAKLLHFFYHAGPREAADTSEAISREEAISIAKKHIGDRSQVPTTVTAALGALAVTTAPVGVVLRSAELVHTAAPGITGGREMLVWIVKLGGSQPTGEVRATVYIDAITSEVLVDIVG